MYIYRGCELTVNVKTFFFSQIYEVIYNKQTNNAYHNAKLCRFYTYLVKPSATAFNHSQL